MPPRKKRPPELVSDLHPGRPDLPEGTESIDIRVGPDGSPFYVPVVPRALRQPGPDQLRAMRQLQELARLSAYLREATPAAVESARVAGMSWDSIGWCLGLTGTTVRQRFGE